MRCENELISMSRVWDKEKIWVPDRIRTYALQNIGRALHPLELRTRTHGERGHILGSHLTRVLHTARISNVDVVLCGERMKDVDFKLGQTKVKMNYNQHVTGVGQNVAEINAQQN